MLLPIFGASEDGDRAWGHHLHDVWNVESVGSGSHDSPEGGKSLPLQNTHEHGCRTYMAGFSVRDSWGSSSCIGIFELNRIIVLSVQPPLLLSFGQGKKKNQLDFCGGLLARHNSALRLAMRINTNNITPIPPPSDITRGGTCFGNHL